MVPANFRSFLTFYVQNTFHTSRKRIILLPNTHEHALPDIFAALTRFQKMDSSAALFVKQQLKTRQDMLVLGQLLNDAMADYIEVRQTSFLLFRVPLDARWIVR